MPIPTTQTQEPAYSIVQRLGGKSEVAAHLNLDRSTLSRWCSPRPIGTGGMIPQQYWPALTKLARLKGVRISLKELANLEG